MVDADTRLTATSRDGDRVDIRRATPADEQEMQRFFSSVTMDADLQLAVRRAPSLLDLYEVQSSTWETWVGYIGDEMVGMGTMLAREGYVQGERTRVGYLGDLRLDPRVRGRSVLSAMYGPVLDGFARRHEVDMFLTAVIASNDRAVQALTSDKARAVGIPTYHLIRKFDIRAVQLLQPRRMPRAAGLEVRRAATHDIPAIAAFLDADARTRPFGMPIDEVELRRRLATWTGLCIEDFHLVHRDGALVGCLATWDTVALKQTLVEAYRGSMRRVRAAYNLAAAVLRAERLPAAGGRLPYAYATHHAVTGDDVDVQRLLLGSVYRAMRGTGSVFVSCFVPVDDPLEPAYRGYVTNNLPARLYAVVPFGGDLPEPLLQPGRPGFEMAFA